MASFDTASKKQVETSPQDFVDQGIQQGIQQGTQETIRENILETLAFRLQSEVAQTFKSALDSIDDLQRLKQLFRAAMRVETVEEFTQALNENDN